MHNKNNNNIINSMKAEKKSQNNKKLIIPNNLNIKEEQLAFFTDIQNVQTLFSELKSIIEKANIKNETLAEKNESLITENTKLKQELAKFENMEKASSLCHSIK